MTKEPLATIPIYFDDLSVAIRYQIMEMVRNNLLERKIVVKDFGETEEQFLQRLWEYADHHVKTHNFPMEFRI